MTTNESRFYTQSYHEVLIERLPDYIKFSDKKFLFAALITVLS